MASGSTSWIGDATANTVTSNYGSYYTLTPTSLRIISVNTNFWYKVCALCILFVDQRTELICVQQNFWLYKVYRIALPLWKIAFSLLLQICCCAIAWSTDNKIKPTMERDPSGQFAWLVTELEAAKRARE